MNDYANAEASSSKRTLADFDERRGRSTKKKRMVNDFMDGTDYDFYADLRAGAISFIQARPRREAAKEGQERRRLSICALNSPSHSRSRSRPRSEDEDEDEKDQEIWQKIKLQEVHRLGVEGFVWDPINPIIARNIHTDNVWIAEKHPMQGTKKIEDLQQMPKALPSYLFRTPLIQTKLDKVPKILPFTDITFANEACQMETQEQEVSDDDTDDTEELIETFKNIFTKKTLDAADLILKHEQHRISPLPLSFSSMPAFGSGEEAVEKTFHDTKINPADSVVAIDLTGNDDDFEITSVIRLAPDSQMGRAFAKREGFQQIAALQEEIGLPEEDFYAVYNEVKREHASVTGSESKEFSEQPSSGQSSTTSVATTPDQEDELAVEAMMRKISPSQMAEEMLIEDQTQDFMTIARLEGLHNLQVGSSHNAQSEQPANACTEGEDRMMHEDSGSDMDANNDSLRSNGERCVAEDERPDGDNPGLQVGTAEKALQNNAMEVQEDIQTAEKITMNNSPEQEIIDLSLSSGDSSGQFRGDGDEDHRSTDDKEIIPLPLRRKRSSSILVNRFREQDDAEEAERRVQAESVRLEASLKQQYFQELEKQTLLYPSSIAPDLSMNLENLQLNEAEDSERSYSDPFEENILIQQSLSSSKDDQQNHSTRILQTPPSVPAASAKPSILTPKTPGNNRFASSASLPNSPVMSSFAETSHRLAQSHSPSVGNPIAPLYVRGFRGLPQGRRG